MRAMILNEIAQLAEKPSPLQLVDWADPVASADEVLIRVSACGVCHTELDEIEGRLPPRQLPAILGHQAVGRIVATGANVSDHATGDRVGVAWIFSACGACSHCLRGNENLCADFQATGRDAQGGYAELLTAPASFVHRIPDALSDVNAAPLLCAGAIGYRALRLSGIQDGDNLGLTGFGASAHLVIKMVRHRFPQTRVYVFARSEPERAFARELGAVWAGDTLEQAPELLRAIIDTTPAWTPVVAALANLEPGGRLVINAIRKENADKESLLGIDYPAHLWLEKQLRSVANVTRLDVREMLALAAEIPLVPELEEYPLEHANEALRAIKRGKIRGAKVLRIG